MTIGWQEVVIMEADWIGRTGGAPWRSTARTRMPVRDLRRLLDAVPVPLLVVRADPPRFTIVTVTDAYLRTTMTAPDGSGRSILGRALSDVFAEQPGQWSPTSVRALLASLGRVVESGTLETMRVHQYNVRQADGGWEERFWSPTNIPVFDEDARVTYVIHRVEDVTNAMRSDRRASAAEHESEIAQEANAAKARFLAAMSHELRTPLNAIGGYVDLIAMGLHGPVTAQQKEMLERIRRSEQHLIGVITEVLDYAKIEAGRLELDARDIVVRDIISDVQTLVEPQALAKRLHVVATARDTADCELTTYADPEKTRQILVNLLSNAIKFTEPGGHITIMCEACDDRVSIHVADTGCGIRDGYLSAVFEPFVQVGDPSSKRDGTGLGLPISRDLARAMGGDITVTSQLGHGSAFTLTLPRQRREVRERRSAI